MALRPLATRVPKELDEDIREVMEYLKVEKARAVRMILEIGVSEWKKKTALELLRNGQVTFAKAAKLAEVDLWDLAEMLKDRKVEWVKMSSEELEKEAETARKDTDE